MRVSQDSIAQRSSRQSSLIIRHQHAMSTEILPIDVIGHILSFLQSDTNTLETCAQTHPILSDLSERYIYADVVLRDDMSAIYTRTELRTRNFIQILANKSTIANHVRSLEIVCVFGNPRSKQHEATCSHLDGVASLLPMLTGLTRFTIRGSLTFVPCVAWQTMTETFRQAFVRHLHANVMRDTTISFFRFFPMSLLDGCTKARLSLEHCEETQYDGKSQSYPVPFEHISIFGCSEMCLKNIASWVKSHGLRSLKCSPYQFSDSFRLLLDACSNSLTNLHLGSGNLNVDSSYLITHDSAIHKLDEEIPRFPFTLANLSHLTHLTIDTNPQLYYSDQTCQWCLYSPIPTIAELIYTARPTLKRVSIIYDFLFTGSAFEHLPDSTVIWFLFIPLAARCSSASISMHISPSFRIPDSRKIFPLDFFSPLGDYKGLTPYVQSGVVVISEDFLKEGLRSRG